MFVAIIDDVEEDRRQVGNMLREYGQIRGITMEITEYTSGDTFLDTFSPGLFQCVFLDIYMEGKNGMEIAREVYRLDPACRLIFSTVSLEHAVSSYEVHAAWYLAKPYTSQQFAKAMDAACSNMEQQTRSITIHVQGAPVCIRFSDIHYIDCSYRQAKLHLHSKLILPDEQINDLLTLLAEDPRFLLCNRSTSVNMDHIAGVEEHDFRMKNGDRVPLRQRGRAALKKTFLLWSLQELRQESTI